MAYEYTTRATLLSLAEGLTTLRKAEIVESAAKRTPDNRTFLSHSSKDAAILPGVIRVLESHGATVYIDKIDTSLPAKTSRQTATALRSRVAACKKFVLLASDNCKDSKWVPWELGLADGYKRPPNIAIFPTVENRNDYVWAEREYLGIYDRIVLGDLQGYQDKVWMVLNQEANQATELSKWLAA